MAGGVGKLYKNLDLQGNKITGSADPSAATDLINLQYLQNFLRGIDWKESVRVASTGNLSIAAPGASIDGVTMAAGNRVLLKEQTAGAENGIYVWNGAAVAMTRATDADVSADVTAGMATYVAEGTANGDKAFVLTTNDPIVLGTTVLAFTQFGGGSLPVAGNGLVLTGSTLDVGAGTGILSNANDVAIDPAVVPRKFTNAATHSAGTTVSLTHSLGHKDYTVSVKINATGEEITGGVDITCNDNSVDAVFSASQGANTIRITVLG
jgi:phage-related tail fiber protein